MWMLQLNDMRSAKAEYLQNVAISETKEMLVKLVESQKVQRYKTDNKWAKEFKQGGSLEWFNPPGEPDDHYIDIGTREGWAQSGREQYDVLISGCEFLE